MKIRTTPVVAGVAVLLVAWGCGVSRASASQYESVTVYSAVFNDYKHPRLADGTICKQTYAFGEGQRFDRNVANNEINELPFRKVIEAVALPLASKGYVPGREPKSIELLIMVNWGATTGETDDFASALSMNDVNLLRASEGRASLNARLLGYVDKLEQAREMPWLSSLDSIREELTSSRYFVVLQAFDFQVLRKEHRQKLLWETRFSISQQGNLFGEQIAGMARRAAPYFGDGNGKLVRRAYPKGNVHVGTPVEVKDVGD